MPPINQAILFVILLLTCFYMALSFGAHINRVTSKRWGTVESVVMLIVMPFAYVLLAALIAVTSPILAGVYLAAQIKKEDQSRTRTL